MPKPPKKSAADSDMTPAAGNPFAAKAGKGKPPKAAAPKKKAKKK